MSIAALIVGEMENRRATATASGLTASRLKKNTPGLRSPAVAVT